MGQLHKKIADIMAEIDRVYRDKEIQTKQGAYKVTTYEVVLDLIRPKLVERGLIIVRTACKSTVVGSICVVDTEYDIIDAETGESLHFASSGAGFDTSDKHAGKAMTYAIKYAMRDLFLLKSTDEDDSDNSGSDRNNERALRAATDMNEVNKIIDQGVEKGLISRETAATLKGHVAATNGDRNALLEARKYLKGTYGLG